ncbi:MAG: hypothetical protein ACK4K9_03255 [Bacteroidia bacterium]
MIKFLIYLLVFYVIFRFIFGTLFKVNVFQFNTYNQSKPTDRKPEGTITITRTKKQNNGKGADTGEYVDYEEVK